MLSMYLISVLIFSFLIYSTDSTWFCVDEWCSEPIITGKAQITRSKNSKEELPVKRGDKILIYGYNNNSKTYLVKKEKGNEFGVVPSQMLIVSNKIKGIPINNSVFNKLISKDITKIPEQHSYNMSSKYKLTMFLNMINSFYICTLGENTIEIENNVDETISKLHGNKTEIKEGLFSRDATSEKKKSFNDNNSSLDHNLETTEKIHSSDVANKKTELFYEASKQTTETKEKVHLRNDSVEKVESFNKDGNLVNHSLNTKDTNKLKQQIKIEKMVYISDSAIEEQKLFNVNSNLTDHTLETKNTRDDRKQKAKAEKEIQSPDIENEKKESFNQNSSLTNHNLNIKDTIETLKQKAKTKEEIPFDDAVKMESVYKNLNTKNTIIKTSQLTEAKKDVHSPDIVVKKQELFNENNLTNRSIETKNTAEVSQQQQIKTKDEIYSANMVVEKKESFNENNNLTNHGSNTKDTNELKQVKAKEVVHNSKVMFEEQKLFDVNNSVIDHNLEIKDIVDVEEQTAKAEKKIPSSDVKNEKQELFNQNSNLTDHNLNVKDTSETSKQKEKEKVHFSDEMNKKVEVLNINLNTKDTIVKVSEQQTKAKEVGLPQVIVAKEESFNGDNGQTDYIEDTTEASKQQAKTKEEISFYDAVIEKMESLYIIIFEYLHNFSTVSDNIHNLGIHLHFYWSIYKSMFKDWFSGSQYRQTEVNYEDPVLQYTKDYNIPLNSSKLMSMPFWDIMEKDNVTIYIGVFLSISLLMISVTYLILSWKKNKNINALIGTINVLEKKLLVATKEIAILEEKVTNLDYEETEIIDTNDENVKEIFKPQIEELKLKNTELEDKIAYLEKELESVSTSALEMHTLLENSLATQANSELTRNEVEELHMLTEKQENQIIELRDEMDSILLVNDSLKENNNVLKSSIKKLETECNNQIKKNLELSEKNRDLTLSLDKQIEANSSLESNYKSEIYQLRSKLDDMEMNLKRADVQIAELNRANSIFIDKHENKTSDELKAFYNDYQLKIQVSTLEAMNNDLTTQLKKEKNDRRMLDEHVGDAIKELNNLKKNFEIIEKERNDAVTKLNVLTDYFKEKETQLHKELEAKEKLVEEIDNKDQSFGQKLASLKEEINSYKLRNENLEKEILDQERSYKTQLANAEQKARDRWFELRQVERKYQETEKEAASLRNKILILETSLSNLNQKTDEKANIINGDTLNIPPMYHMPISPDLLPYPTSTEFVPLPPSPITSHSMEFFPPEPLYSPDERLPPLGGRRVPSPPPLLMPADDFAPPPPDIKYMSRINRNETLASPSHLRSPSPTNRNRSQYKIRRQKNSLDSPSSGLSVESLDKSGR